jgi:hypothetical protein
VLATARRASTAPAAIVTLAVLGVVGLAPVFRSFTGNLSHFGVTQDAASFHLFPGYPSRGQLRDAVLQHNPSANVACLYAFNANLPNTNQGQPGVYACYVEATYDGVTTTHRLSINVDALNQTTCTDNDATESDPSRC